MRRTCSEPVDTSKLATGIDVSEYQGEPDWPAIARAGYSFAFLRSGAGKHVDAQFKRNWYEAHSAGLRVGVYHYFRAGVGGIAQAELMANQVAGLGGFQRGDLGPVLDLENKGQEVDGEELDPAYVVGEARAFLSRVEAATRWRPIVYTGVYFHWRVSQARSQLAGGWGHYPLWIPSIDGTCPRLPLDVAGRPFPWSDWAFWQYSHTGAVPGISGAVDLNYFNGDAAALGRFANRQAPSYGGLALMAGLGLGALAAWHYSRR